MASKRIILRIVDRTGPCPRGHDSTQEWDITDGVAHDLCHWAWNSVYPFYLVLRHGGRFAWHKGDAPSTSIEVGCPDPDNAQRFRLEVVERE
jgi:uncharacterized repeat protein (TIGR04076 family)